MSSISQHGVSDKLSRNERGQVYVTHLKLWVKLDTSHLLSRLILTICACVIDYPQKGICSRLRDLFKCLGNN